MELPEEGAPRLADTVDVGLAPEALAVSPDGQWVAVVSNSDEDCLLTLVRRQRAGLGLVSRFPLRELGIVGNGQGPRGGLTATQVQWHPSGRYLAVNLNTWNRVVFLEVIPTSRGSPRVRPWGLPVETGVDPFVGRFTPDGGYYITADWGRNLTAPTLEERIPRRPSSLSVIRLDRSRASTPRHQRVGGALTDESSEGLAISPDGRLVATVNMRGTPFLPDSPRFVREATVTLLAFDARTGTLRKLSDHPFEGVLPEGATFDASGRHLLVTVFQSHEGGPAGGALEVFRVQPGNQARLHHVGRIPMPHGVHHVRISH
ncbi:lactonase family protein [Myxococcus stipitatus]|uniref:lactonase family protein n=1 Tax=Myxococcus stipitatus TaxID=83455 RepID=UPI001F397767|nr:lactonase family protein [Myxococcus stipitatus]MCE9671213.1 lactonase family protein [Myxococcus stipitatus]